MKTKIKMLYSTLLLTAFSLQGVVANAQGTSHKEIKSTESIRTFRVHVSNAALRDMRKRINDTRWPEKETVADQSQGAQLSRLKPLVEYWGKNYDWRKAEAKLNALPQFMTTIDGVDIHFIHVKSKERNALPVIITHGWPGSVFELLKIIDPLTNPTAYGGKPADAFDVVIPSLPGYGFSGKPSETGWGPDRIAKAWAVLMDRLGYKQYVAQGGDWGAGVVNSMARQAPAGLLGIHSNFPATVPEEVLMSLGIGAPAPASLTDQEKAVYYALGNYSRQGNAAYYTMMNARPQAIGYGLTDSPAGLAAWILLHPGFANWTYGANNEASPNKDEVLDNITLYWLTNTAASSARIYWENKSGSLVSASGQRTSEISIPVTTTVFPEDIYRAPQSWTKRAYKNLTYYKEVDKGGHFAAWEQPQLFTEELRAAFRPMRSKVN